MSFEFIKNCHYTKIFDLQIWNLYITNKNNKKNVSNKNFVPATNCIEDALEKYLTGTGYSAILNPCAIAEIINC